MVLDDVNSHKVNILYFYIGNLSSGQFHDLSIIGQWESIEIRLIKKNTRQKNTCFRIMPL